MKIIRSDPTRWRIARKTVTFTGAAGAGAVGTVAVFTVSGDVMVDVIIPKCTTDLTEAGATATIQLGTVGVPAFFQDTTTATTLDQNEYWDAVYAAPARATPVAKTTGDNDVPGVLNQNIIITVGGQAVNGGVIEFTCIWRPISAGATLS